MTPEEHHNRLVCLHAICVRLYREAPMLLIGEGTSDIQKMIIGRGLLQEYARHS